MREESWASKIREATPTMVLYVVWTSGFGAVLGGEEVVCEEVEVLEMGMTAERARITVRGRGRRQLQTSQAGDVRELGGKLASGVVIASAGGPWILGARERERETESKVSVR